MPTNPRFKRKTGFMALTEDIAERARLVYLYIGNNELISQHFPAEYAELIK